MKVVPEKDRQAVASMISVDTLTQKEVQKQDPYQDSKFNLNLLLLQLIAAGTSPVKICKKLDIKKNTLQYHLNKLKRSGLIKKIGYGLWETCADPNILSKTSSKSSHVAINKTPQQVQLFRFFQEDNIRAHAFVFTLKVPKGLRNWNNKNRETFLRKKKLDFLRLRIGGSGQRIIFKGKKIWLTDKSIVIYDRDSYFAESSSEAKSYAISKLLSLVKGLERLLHADFTERAGRQYTFKVSRQHYALVQNALAKQYDAEGKKLNVYSAKGLWFVIDNSFNLHEAETVHPETADIDNTKVQNFFNSLKEYPLTTDFLLQAIQDIIQSQQNNLQIQSVFSENMRSHLQVLEDIGISINTLTKLIGELKGGGLDEK